MSDRRFLAIDLGASSGRGIIGRFDGRSFALEEIHRFSNDPVQCPGGFFWDTMRLVLEIQTSMSKAGTTDSIGIDTWGVDYGYIDKAGTLLSNPYHYRDARTAPQMDRVERLISYDKLYGITGIEKMSFNTVYQIASDAERRPWLIEKAEKLLLMPDLLSYMLCGECACEYTIASTTAMLDAAEKKFSKEICDTLGVPSELFCNIVMPSNIVGKTKEGVSVVNVASHDTASAILAVPSEKQDFLFISSGTWSLMGTESADPVINSASCAVKLTNEGGALGKINVMKNIMGLWLSQESRRQWKREGRNYSFDELAVMAENSSPLRYIINPDDPVFMNSGDMPTRIREYCISTDQGAPETPGEIIRCIFESLAMRYRATAELIERMCRKKYDTINIVGGGTKEKMLNRFTADCTGKCVIAGPCEATALGNIAMQAIACGAVSSPLEARRIIAASSDVEIFEPNAAEKGAWDEAYGKFNDLCK